jgi:FkbM family methyltransferase
MARLYPKAFFIQVGANDGDQLDPLRTAVHRADWRGIMVEPVPYVFQKLKANNGHLARRVRLENVAIADICGQLPFWHLPQAQAGEGLPRLYDAIGSFRKDVVLKHINFIPDIEDRLVCTNVDCITFEELCRRNEVESLDILQIDTEGYDFEIIKMIDFERLAPTLLIYEHHHFDEETDRECRQFLRGKCYDLFKEGMDTWCLKVNRGDDSRRKELERYWQKLGKKAGSRR